MRDVCDIIFGDEREHEGFMRVAAMVLPRWDALRMRVAISNKR